jgi:hypothetical protein
VNGHFVVAIVLINDRRPERAAKIAAAPDSDVSPACTVRHLINLGGTMKWKILTAFDVVFSTIAVIAALVLGNAIVARHVPALHDNATWLSKLIVNGLRTPDNLAKWALGALPIMIMFLVFVFCVVSESLLVMFSPLVERMAAFAASQRFSVDFSVAYQEITGDRAFANAIRRQMFQGVMARLLGGSSFAFVVGLFAGAIAWCVALLINANTGGLIQTIAVVAAIVVLLFINEILGDIVKEAIGDDKSIEIFRERFTHAEP